MDTFLVSDVNATFLLKKSGNNHEMNCCHQLCTKAAVVRCKHSITCTKQKKQYNNFSFFDNSGFAKLVGLFETKTRKFFIKTWPHQYWKDKTVQHNFLSLLVFSPVFFLAKFSRYLREFSPSVRVSIFSGCFVGIVDFEKLCFLCFLRLFLCFLRVSFFGRIFCFLELFDACFSKRRWLQNQGLQEMILCKRGSSRMSPGQMHTDDQANQSWTFEWFWEVQHIFLGLVMGWTKPCHKIQPRV